MILWIIVIVFALLLAWIIYAAGWRFALQRFGGALLILLIVTFSVSAILRFSGVDDQTKEKLVELGVSPNAQPCVSALGTGADAAAVNQCVADRGLDDNAFVQYGSWVKDMVWEQDLGYAFYKNRETLTDTMKQRLPRSAWLFLYSQITALALAVPMGIWSAYQAGRAPRKIPRRWLPVGLGVVVIPLLLFGKISLTEGLGGVAALIGVVLAITFAFNILRGGPDGDASINFTAFALLSIPVFVLGESLRYVFAIQFDVYDLTGYEPWSEGVGAHFRSIWLPTLVLGLAATPVYLRLLRADMIQNLQQDFVSVAKAKGMSNRHILFRHVLRPSTVTLLTVLGLNIAQLVNGAIVVEFIYDFDGMGSYLIAAVARREFFAVQTIVALVAVLFVLTNTVIDVLYTSVDPRVKAEGKA